MRKIFYILQELLERMKDLQQTLSENSRPESLVKLQIAKEYLSQVNDECEIRYEDLRKSVTKSASNYYWLIFAVIYVGIYFVQ